VREEDGLHVGQPDGAQQLALGPLAAVEEQAVGAPAHERGRQAAASGRHRAGRTGEEEREVHARGSRVPPPPLVPAPTGPLDSFAPVPRTPGIVKEFREFILRGNVVDLAVAVVVGAAFTAIVTSFTKSIIEPLINAVTPPSSPGFGIQLVEGKANTYIDLAAIITAAINFVIVAAVIYFAIVLPVNVIQERRRRGEETGPAEPTEVELLAEIRDLLSAQQRPSDQPRS